MPKKTEPVLEKTQQKKSILLEFLRKIPIVQVACEKSGVSRASYYRWREEDTAFSEEADIALDAGIAMMNDMAESKLLSAIQEGNMTSIIFWLKNRHHSYRQRVEVSAGPEKPIPLTEDQQQQVAAALSLALPQSSEPTSSHPLDEQ